MSSLETIYKKMSPIIDTTSLAHLRQASPAPEEGRQMSRDVAHELNNVITIIRGYAERLLLKHGENPALRPDLQLISANARRAENVVRQATQKHRLPTSTVTA
jgi:signal transduction histidine kinase